MGLFEKLLSTWLFQKKHLTCMAHLLLPWFVRLLKVSWNSAIIGLVKIQCAVGLESHISCAEMRTDGTLEINSALCWRDKHISQNHAWYEGTSGDCLGQAICSSRVSQNRLSRTVSSMVLSIFNDRDFTTSLANLLLFNQPHSKKYFNWCLLPLAVSLGTT